jgi:glutamate-5-semialdehyde dehydrogenase
MAQDIAVSAKCGRPGVCNAIENLVVEKSIASQFLPDCARALIEKGCKIFADTEAQSILSGMEVSSAGEDEFAEEFLDLRIAIKVVDSLSEGIAFINQYGSGHSESIITENPGNAEMFLNNVDASSVYWNASTRYTDGFEFGLGAEIGISTDRLHARGPMGLEELCTYKYQIIGSGQWK